MFEHTEGVCGVKEFKPKEPVSSVMLLKILLHVF